LAGRKDATEGNDAGVQVTVIAEEAGQSNARDDGASRVGRAPRRARQSKISLPVWRSRSLKLESWR
jgi:hypothetical protein